MAKKEETIHIKAPRIPKKIAKQWAGRTGAVVENKVVAGGDNTTEAIAKAQQLYPDLKEWEIGIMSIPPKEGYLILWSPS